MVNLGAASPRIAQRTPSASGWYEPALSGITGLKLLNRLKVDNGFYVLRAQWTMTTARSAAPVKVYLGAGLPTPVPQIAGTWTAVTSSFTQTIATIDADSGGVFIQSVADIGALAVGNTLHLSATWLI